jgi:hypothetical protein
LKPKPSKDGFSLLVVEAKVEDVAQRRVWVQARVEILEAADLEPPISSPPPPVAVSI